jgi:hypothetical protein
MGRKSQIDGLFPKISGNVGPISLHFRLRGGARSLALTFLCLNSLLTGKNTGKFARFCSRKSHSWFSKSLIPVTKLGGLVRNGANQNREVAGKEIVV